MSTTSTPTRRRRIAGERKPRTPDHRVAEPAAREVESDDLGADRAGRVRRVVQADDRPGEHVEPPATRDTREPSGSTGPDERRPVPARLLGALGVVAVLLVAFAASGFGLDGVGVQAWQQHREQQAVAAAARSAPAAAERAAAAILAYDHRTLEADRDNAARFMTGDYRREYLDTFGLVLDNAPDLKAVVRAEVRASGVAHADPERVRVLLFVNQTTTSTANGGEPQTALNRVVMTMQRAGADWLVDGITSY
jgi:Mce-associated membrane protein